VACNPDSRIVRQHALNALGHLFRAIGDRDLPGVLRVSNSNPSAVGGDANKSWTATTESQSEHLNPTRTIESHTQGDNRTVDKQSLQRRGSDGKFEPYQDIEKESVQVNACWRRGQV
jgi:hypothetical protein